MHRLAGGQYTPAHKAFVLKSKIPIATFLMYFVSYIVYFISGFFDLTSEGFFKKI
jgi:hypothetical protein